MGVVAVVNKSFLTNIQGIWKVMYVKIIYVKYITDNVAICPFMVTGSLPRAYKHNPDIFWLLL